MNRLEASRVYRSPKVTPKTKMWGRPTARIQKLNSMLKTLQSNKPQRAHLIKSKNNRMEIQKPMVATTLLQPMTRRMPNKALGSPKPQKKIKKTEKKDQNKWTKLRTKLKEMNMNNRTHQMNRQTENSRPSKQSTTHLMTRKLLKKICKIPTNRLMPLMKEKMMMKKQKKAQKNPILQPKMRQPAARQLMHLHKMKITRMNQATL